MALVACIDCGQQMSDLAPACPRCGRPAIIQEQQPTPQVVVQQLDAKGSSTFSGVLMALIVFFVVIPLGSCVACMACGAAGIGSAAAGHH